ncbi:SLC13 family permease [Actinomycetes bacterium NPDC127524]
MMTLPLFLTMIILFFTLVFLIHGKFRADLIALASLLALGLTHILTPEEVLSGFSNSVVIMIAGLYIVGAGIFNTGLTEVIGSQVIKMSKGSRLRLLIISMITTAILSGLLSGTGIVAILLPIVMSMAIKQKASPSRFLIPIAYASSMGGVLTLIGTPPNLIVDAVLKKNGFDGFKFFDFTPIGLIILAAGLIFMLAAGRKLLPDRSAPAGSGIKGLSAGELAGMYKIYDRLHYLHIPAHSDLVGERLSDLKLPEKYEITVIEIKRENDEKSGSDASVKDDTLSANADEIFHPEDIILVFGAENDVCRLAKDYELELKHFNTEQIKSHFASSEFGLTEILIMPNSDYENQTLRDIHFREKYQCSVLAINRKGEYIQADAGNEQLNPGDALLIHGKWENIERISADLQDIIVIGSAPEESERSPYSAGKALMAAVITGLMILFLSIDIISPTIAVLSAAFLMIVTGCVRSIEEAYQRVQWESVILIGALIPLSGALEKTGGLLMISTWMEKSLGDLGPYGVLAGFYLLTMLLGQFVSNAATAIIIAPIAFTCAINMHYSPDPILMSVAVAASMAFTTPVASPTNALVMTAGEYRLKDFALIGILLQILIGIIMIFTIPLFFPF